MLIGDGVRTRFAGSKTVAVAMKVVENGGPRVALICVAPVALAGNWNSVDAVLTVAEAGTSSTPLSEVVNVRFTGADGVTPKSRTKDALPPSGTLCALGPNPGSSLRMTTRTEGGSVMPVLL